jgi:hypothetical protein
MNEDRRRVLGLLAEGRITADEAERLLAALERPGAAPGPGATPIRAAPRYLRVEVDANDTHRGGPAKVNVRVPMSLLRAGVRLGALIPPQARDEVNAAMARRGVAFDISQLKPENLDAVIEQLGDMTVDLAHDRAKVRVYCE